MEKVTLASTTAPDVRLHIAYRFMVRVLNFNLLQICSAKHTG